MALRLRSPPPRVRSPSPIPNIVHRNPSPLRSIEHEIEREMDALELETEARAERMRGPDSHQVTVSTPYIRVHRHDLGSAHAQHAILRLYRDLIRHEQERPRPNITSLEIGPEDDHSHVLVAIIQFADAHGDRDREWRVFWNSVLDEQLVDGATVRVHSFSPVISMQRSVRKRVSLGGGDELGEGVVRREERSRYWAPVSRLLH